MEKGTKVCGRCDTQYPIENFWNDKSQDDGKDVWCTDCRKRYNRLRTSGPNRFPTKKEQAENEFIPTLRHNSIIEDINRDHNEEIEKFRSRIDGYRSRITEKQKKIKRLKAELRIARRKGEHHGQR